MRPVLKTTLCGVPVSVYRRVAVGMSGSMDGLCHKYGGRFVISVRPGLSPQRELEVLIHELLHASDWTKDESWVHDTARDIATALSAMGYGRCV